MWGPGRAKEQRPSSAQQCRTKVAGCLHCVDAEGDIHGRGANHADGLRHLGWSEVGQTALKGTDSFFVP